MQDKVECPREGEGHEEMGVGTFEVVDVDGPGAEQWSDLGHGPKSWLVRDGDERARQGDPTLGQGLEGILHVLEAFVILECVGPRSKGVKGHVVWVEEDRPFSVQPRAHQVKHLAGHFIHHEHALGIKQPLERQHDRTLGGSHRQGLGNHADVRFLLQTRTHFTLGLRFIIGGSSGSSGWNSIGGSSGSSGSGRGGGSGSGGGGDSSNGRTVCQEWNVTDENPVGGRGRLDLVRSYVEESLDGR